MNFPTLLTRGIFLRRYKRFLVDVELDTGEIIVAHCANTGSMKTLLDSGNVVYVSSSLNPKTKLDWILELICVDGTLVGVNTSRPNKIVEEAILNDKIAQLTGYSELRREVKYCENSRIDILLEDTIKVPCYVEVKNCTMSRDNNITEFPDAITSRGAKHLESLITMVEQGNRAVMLYLVNRDDCDIFKIAKDIDNLYYSLFIDAIEKGVEVYAYNVDTDISTGIVVNKQLRVEKV